MRVKALRKLLWFLNTLLVVGIVAYALFFFILGGVQKVGARQPEALIGKRNLPDGAPKVMRDKVLPWPTFNVVHKLVIDGDLPIEVIPEGPGVDTKPIPPLAQNYDLLWVAKAKMNKFNSFAHLQHKASKKVVHIQIGEFVEHVRTGDRREEDWQLVEVDSGRPWRAVFMQDGTEDSVTLEVKIEKAPGVLDAGKDADPAAKSGTIGGGAKSDKPPREGPTKGLIKRGENEWDVPPEEAEWWGEYGEEEIQKKIAVDVVKGKDGKPIGLMVKSVEDKSMLKRRDIRSGDILKSINGKPVKSRQGIINYVKGEGKGLTTYTVIIERAGREITKTYHVKEKKKKKDKKSAGDATR